MTQSDVTRRPTITIHMVQGAWRRPRPTLQKLDQSARGPGESPFWKDLRCPCSAGGCMSHEWRRAVTGQRQWGKGDTCQCTLLAGEGSGMDEGGCSRGFCSENLRSLSGRDNCTRLELPERTINKQEFSLMGRWQVPGRAWKEADFSSTNDFQDGLDGCNRVGVGALWCPCCGHKEE